MSLLSPVRRLFGREAAANPFAELPAAPAPMGTIVRQTPVEASDAQLSFVLPQVRDRWLVGRVAQYTPERIEGVLRGALSGYLLHQWQLFDLMEATWPRLSKVLNEIKKSVQGLDWAVQAYVESGTRPTKTAEAKAAFVRDVVKSMRWRPDADESNFQGMLYDALDAVGKGISVQELLWENSPLEGGGPAVVRPYAARWVPPRFYGYPPTSSQLMLNGREVGMNLPPAYEGVPGSVGQWYPFVEDKFLLSVNKHRTGHPAGTAAFRCLAWWWIMTQFASEWFANFAQIWGQPLRWATYDPSRQGLREALAEMLESMGSAAWAAFPEGTKLEILEAGKQAGEGAQMTLLKYSDTIIDIFFLGQTLTTTTGQSGGGSHALGKVQEGVRGDIIRGVSEWLGQVLNTQFIPAILRQAYGETSECPWFMPARGEAKDAVQMVQRDAALQAMGIDLPKVWLYERHDVPLPEEGEEVVPGRAAGSGGQDGQGAEDGGTGQSQDGEGDVESDEGDGVSASAYAKASARQGRDKLVDNVLEGLTGVEARWLGGVKPDFARLMVLAKDKDVTDAEFLHALTRAKGHFPELFGKMDKDALKTALENAMASAAVNGVAKGVMGRPASAKASARRIREANSGAGKASR